ncbi:MAG: DUF4388 domain-containing protein [Nitrospirota bacterium]
MPVPRSGKIPETPLSDVFEHLRQTQASGTLTVSKNTISKQVYFKAGKIVCAASLDANDRLGEILIKWCNLSPEHLQRALEISKKSAGLKRLGAVLVENGVITPKELFHGLKIQVRDIITSLFLWTEGEYNFQDGLPSDTIQLQINIEDIITEILNRIKNQI